MLKNKNVNIIPGVTLAAGIAVIAQIIEGLLPIHLIGDSVIALFMGMAINYFLKPSDVFKTGVNFTSKKLLRVAIIFLGASLSVGTILTVGKNSLIVMFFTLLTCFGGGYFIGKALGLNWKMSNLISAGTGICGGSAIAAIAPVIDADDTDIAFGMSATFIFDMIMILIFPAMGAFLGLSDTAYGLWTGTAVNDTSSVVAAGYAFSEAAGDYATMVKLTRTLSIIPAVLIFSMINIRVKRKEATKTNTTVTDTITGKVNFMEIIPWFILGFLALAGLNSLGFIPENVGLILKNMSKFLMVMSLAAIGIKTDVKHMKQAGLRPMLHGFIISALVVIVAITVQYAVGII